MSMRSVVLSLVQAVLLGVLGTAALSAQDPTGTITGRVTDSTTGAPIPSVQLNVVGTNVGAQTSSDGQFTIRGVRAGVVSVRAARVGFAEQRQSVTVAAGQSATLNFRMSAVAVSLAPVVTTATGQQRRVEVGNAIAQVDAANIVETRSVSNVADLLTARAPGVQVVPGTQTGAGARVRIRGTSSLSLNNDPLYVVDGVRIVSDNGSSTISVGGTTPGRIGDLNPEEIESIEVVRGPSAATLYGTDAANGVIVITTKRGIAGRPQWTYYTEQTAMRDENPYPTAYTGWRSTTTPANLIATQCFLFQVASGACVQDSVTSYNLHDDPQATPYGTGYRQQHGLQLRGGSDVVRYFLHGEWEDEDGVTKVPEFEQQFLRRNGLTLRSDQQDPSALNKITGRANVNVTLSPKADLAVTAGYITQDLRMPLSDDSFTRGIAANVYGGPGYRYNVNPQGDTLYGWRQFTPRNIYQHVSTQSVERFISSFGGNYRPANWLALRGNFGLDYIQRQDTQLCRFEECTPLNDNSLGFKRDNRTSFYVYTVDAGATGTRTLTESIESSTTIGAQFYRNIFNGNRALGSFLPPGATTVTAGSVIEASETTTESRTFGAYIEQNLAFGDRLFLTGAVRSDRNSAFGADFETVFYPKFSASWVLSDEPFFPDVGWMNQLRLRTAYGASGVQPGTTDAVQFFSPAVTYGESGEQTGLVFSTLGNRNLKPERSSEIEVGLDGTFWNSRISTEVTYYAKSSRDALISRILPPSIGTGATARLENLGEVRNSGFEGLITAQLLQRDALGWDISFNGSTNENELVSLGGVPEIIGTTQSQREGYPLYGWWSRGLESYEDKDNDGIIEYNADQTLSEITVTDTAVFHGYSIPRYELAVVNGFDLFRGMVRLSAMVDYKGGHKVYNNSERIRCSARNNCAGLIDPNSSLFEQARTVLVRQHPSRSVAGFFEDGDFIRFREASVTFTAPDQWANRIFRGRSIVATLAARNLGVLWTKYTGVDPEAFAGTGDAPSSFQAFAPPTYYSLRLTLGF